MKYKINKKEELQELFEKRNIKTSNDLSNLGKDKWNKKFKNIINPDLFEKPNNKEELEKLIKNNFPLLLIDTSRITNFESLFKNDIFNKNLKSKEYWENPMNYLGFWNISAVTNISNCFCKQKHFNQQIYWDTKNVVNAFELFYKCHDFNQKIEFNLSKCQNISGIFYGCIKFNSGIVLKNLVNVKDANSLFYNCIEFNQPVKLSLPECQDISSMFYNCYKLNCQVVLNNLINVKDANSLFISCKNLNKPVDLDLPNCQNISRMFFKCYNLNSKLKLKNINNVKDIENLFTSCYKLKFKNIESIINQLIIKSSNINKLEKEIEYKLPEEYKNKINNKQFNVINQI